MPAPAPPLAGVDEVASATSAEELVALLTAGTLLAASPIRCPVTDPDATARGRLDLALRTMRSQPAAHWCRPAGEATVVVLRWPLPARGIALFPADDGSRAGNDPAVLLLAVGRAGGQSDVWRFRRDPGPMSPVGARAHALLDGLAGFAT